MIYTVFFYLFYLREKKDIFSSILLTTINRNNQQIGEKKVPFFYVNALKRILYKHKLRENFNLHTVGGCQPLIHKHINRGLTYDLLIVIYHLLKI